MRALRATNESLARRALATVALTTTLAVAGCTFLASFEEKDSPAGDAGPGDDDDTPVGKADASEASSNTDAKAVKDAKTGG